MVQRGLSRAGQAVSVLLIGLALLAASASADNAGPPVPPPEDAPDEVPQDPTEALEPIVDPKSINATQTQQEVEATVQEALSEAVDTFYETAREVDEAADDGHDEGQGTSQSLQDQLHTVVETVQQDVQRLLDDTQDEADRTVNSIPVEDLESLLDEPEDEPAQPAAMTIDPAPEDATTILVIATVVAAAGTGAAILFFGGSTGSVATASSLGAKSAAARAGKGIPEGAMFSPLFTRFEGREVLKHPNRMRLYTVIAEHPGICLHDLCKETALSRTAVTHHLHLLEKQHLIVSERVGRSRHYYENGGRYERQKKEAYAVLQNDRSQDVARFVLDNPGSIQKRLCEGLGLSASLIHWHVKRLETAQLVERVQSGRTVKYYPSDDLARLSF